MTEKKALRAEIRAKIAALPQENILRGDRLICERVLALPEARAAKRVFTYYSVGREADTRAIIKTLRDWGKIIALPVVHGKGLMTFANIHDIEITDTDIPGAGISCAESAERLTPARGDLLLVPALCYDRQNYRLGQGGGYYDRYLTDCPARSVGLCRAALLVNRLPTEPHDVPVDIVVTDE